ncbi:hypothetical protein ACL90Y_06615 [Micrococcus luteus]
MAPEQAGGDEVPVVPDGPPHRWALLVVLTLVVAAMLVAAFAVTKLPQCKDEARFSWAPCLDRGGESRGQTPADG